MTRFIPKAHTENCLAQPKLTLKKQEEDLEKKKRWMNREGPNNYRDKEDISGSGRSMRGYILTQSWL